jgi:hypothetical protein
MVTVDENLATAKSNSESPIRAVQVTISKVALDQYTSQIRKFADTYSFAIRVSHSSPSPEDILVQMWREDVKIIGVNASDPGAREVTFDIALYRSCDCVGPIQKASIDQLIHGLQQTVGQVHGAVFSEIK